jgi:hypothetical protein
MMYRRTYWGRIPSPETTVARMGWIRETVYYDGSTVIEYGI